MIFLKKIVRIAKKVLLPAIFWIAVWEVCALLVNREVLLPSPLTVAKRFVLLLTDSTFYKSVFTSVARILTGYLVGIAAAVVTATLSFCSKAAATLLNPVFTAVRATPVASFIIIALVWMGRGIVPSFTSALMVLPVVFGSMLEGLSSASPALYEVAEIYKFGFMKKLRLLYLPSAVPAFVASLKTSLGLAWKAGVAAEVLCTPKNSIGSNIYSSKLYLETADLFAWTLTVILLSLLLELLLSVSTTKLCRKYTVSDAG